MVVFSIYSGIYDVFLPVSAAHNSIMAALDESTDFLPFTVEVGKGQGRLEDVVASDKARFKIAQQLLFTQDPVLPYEFVTWVDADAALFKSPSDLRDRLLSQCPNASLFLDSFANLSQSTPIAKINLGTFMIRRSAWSQQLLLKLTTMHEIFNASIPVIRYGGLLVNASEVQDLSFARSYIAFQRVMLNLLASLPQEEVAQHVCFARPQAQCMLRFLDESEVDSCGIIHAVGDYAGGIDKKAKALKAALLNPPG